MDLAYKTSEALETGMVAVNTPFLSSAETPFGGIKQSGYGREGGSVGIKDYLNLKYTHLGLIKLMSKRLENKNISCNSCRARNWPSNCHSVSIMKEQKLLQLTLMTKL